MMSLHNLNAFLADVTPAPSANSGPPPQSPLPMVLMMGVFGVMIYFLMIRPQSQQRKKQAEMLKSLKPGDKIVTVSGIVGQVLSVKEKTVSIRSADAKMEITQSSVAEIVERGDEKSAS